MIGRNRQSISFMLYSGLKYIMFYEIGGLDGRCPTSSACSPRGAQGGPLVAGASSFRRELILTGVTSVIRVIHCHSRGLPRI